MDKGKQEFYRRIQLSLKNGNGETTKETTLIENFVHVHYIPEVILPEMERLLKTLKREWQREILKDVLESIENPQHKHYSNPKRYIKSLISTLKAE